MASQVERVLWVVGMCGNNLESMAEDGDPEQEMLVVQDELPQTDPEPEIGAAAAVAYDTSPSLLRNPPPIPAETAQPSVPNMAQLCAMLAAMNANMETNLKANAKQTSKFVELMSPLDGNFRKRYQFE